MPSVGGRRYLSYLLRLWQAKDNGAESWRASLEDPHTGERRGFPSLRALIKFLFQQTQNDETEKQNDQILEKDKD